MSKLRIHREYDSTTKDYDDFRCDVCNQKINSGNRFRQFKNSDIDEFCIDNSLDRKSVIEHKSFHTIHNEYFIKICEKCFKPKIYRE